MESSNITETVNFTPSNNNEIFITYLIIIFIILIIVLIFYNLFHDVKTNKQENMTNGTLTQLFANDAQDMHLKGNIDQYASGDFQLNWNHPTRLTNTMTNRGKLYKRDILVNKPIQLIKNNVNDDNHSDRSCKCSKSNKQYINIDNGSISYLDAYTGSYYADPIPDVNKPYPVIPSSNLAI